MMTRPEAEAIYDAGKETVVRVLLRMDARIHSLEQQVRDLTTRLDLSDKRVRHLEEQLAKNSHNSSKPPSSDGFKKPSPKSLRKKSKRKSGGQPGHTGHTLKRAEKPDHTEKHRVESCACCGRSLAGQQPESVEKRQVQDLPPLRLILTEYQAETKTCCCGHLNKAAFPEGVNAPGQYGEGIKAAAVYLKNYQYLPYDRTCELLNDFFSCPMSEGTLANIISQCDDLAEKPVAQIKERIEQASVAHFDWPGSPNWSSSYVSPGTRLQVEYLSSIDVLSRPGRREGVARPERPSGCVLAKLLGVATPRLLWGRSSLYSRRQSSSTTLASVNVQSCSRSSPSSRKRAWKLSIYPFCHGLPGSM